MEIPSKQIVLKGITLQMLQEDILRCEVSRNVNLTLDLIMELRSAGNSLCPDRKYKVLTVFNGIFIPNKDAMTYAAGNSRTDKVIAEAFCINSPALKIISNFYFRVKKPVITSKVFDNESLALNWLKKQ